MMRIVSFALLSLLLSINLSIAEPQTIRIGVLYGFSGAPAKWSEYGRMGLELARDEINSNGGLDGRKVELIFEDSQMNPAQSVTGFKRLVDFQKVDLVIGNVFSITTNPIIPLAEKNQMLLISPTVMDRAVEKTNRYFFTMGYKMDSIRNAVEKFFTLNPDIKTAALISHDDAWGRAHSELYNSIMKEKGIKVLDEIWQLGYGNDFRTEITRIGAKKPDLIISPYFAEIIKERMHEQGVKAKILSTSDVTEALYLRVKDKKLLDGVYFTYWEPDQEFRENFEAKFGRQPLLEAHNHYEALRSLAVGYQENPKDLLAGIRKVKYQGVAGEIDFTKGSFVNNGIGELYQIKNSNYFLVN